MQPRLSIVSLAVADLARAATFYRDGLGLPADRFREGEDHVAIELQEGLTLVLFEREAIAALAGEELPGSRSRELVLSHSAASAAEVDEILRRAQAAGARIPSPPTREPWGYTGYLLDPDGHLWELLAPPAP